MFLRPQEGRRACPALPPTQADLPPPPSGIDPPILATIQRRHCRQKQSHNAAVSWKVGVALVLLHADSDKAPHNRLLLASPSPGRCSATSLLCDTRSRRALLLAASRAWELGHCAYSGCALCMARSGSRMAGSFGMGIQLNWLNFAETGACTAGRVPVFGAVDPRVIKSVILKQQVAPGRQLRGTVGSQKQATRTSTSESHPVTVAQSISRTASF